MRPPRLGPATRLLLAASLLFAATPALANHLGEESTNAVHLVGLLFHPYPDPQGDPWGLPFTQGNQTGDWMSLRYGAYYFPTAVFDGLTILERTPQGEGGGPFLETYANYRRAYEDRVLQDTPVTIRIDAAVESQTVLANVTLTPHVDLASEPLFLHVVLFEDDVVYDGGNGVINHRFVARTLPATQEIPWRGLEPIPFDVEFPRDEAWDPRHIGFAAWIQNGPDASPRFEPKEVVQAAAWKAGQAGPTVQAQKAVLVELYSATWCEACPPGDAAVDELANSLGLSSARLAASGFKYLRPGDAWTLPLAAAVGILIAAGLRRKPPAKKEPPAPVAGGATP